MSAKVSIEFVVITVHCFSCGVPFGLPDYLEKSRRKDHGNFYCPNGHTNYWPQENEAEKLRRELTETAKRLEFARNETQSLKKQLEKVEAISAKTRKRVARGVCPCCNRTFTNSRMARHIATKHPEFK